MALITVFILIRSFLSEWILQHMFIKLENNLLFYAFCKTMIGLNLGNYLNLSSLDQNVLNATYGHVVRYVSSGSVHHFGILWEFKWRLHFIGFSLTLRFNFRNTKFQCSEKCYMSELQGFFFWTRNKIYAIESYIRC